MAEKDKKEEKFYTPEEVAVAVLKKAHELLKKSQMFKANTSHEIEAGEEPNNDDAECPPSLEEADIENSGAHGEKKSKKSKSGIGAADADGDSDVDGDDAVAMADKDGDGDVDGDDAIEAKEEQTGEDLDGDNEAGEPKEHKEKVKAASKAPKKPGAEEDSKPDQKVKAASKEDAGPDEKKDKKPPFAKSEATAVEKKEKKFVETEAKFDLAKDGGTAGNPTSRIDTGFGKVIARSEDKKACDPKMDLKKPSLKKFMLRRKLKKSAGPTADSRIAEKLSGAPPAPAPQEKIKEQPTPAEKVKAQPKLEMEKNKKETEKLLGISPKAGK